MNAFATLAIAPLISTWLQPGEGWPCRSEAVSTASDVPLHIHPGKPLKRFPIVRSGSTQLKPGANERRRFTRWSLATS